MTTFEARATSLFRGASGRVARAARRSAGNGTAAVLLALATGACDFPTSLPRFETRVAIPFDETRLAVSQLLPAGVTTSANSFLVSVPAASAQRTLGQMCGAPCLTAQGQQVAKPAFTDVFSVTTALPEDVVAATLASGSATLTVSHTFTFDPLQAAPGSTQSGVLRVIVRSGTRDVARDSILPPFTGPITRSLALAPGIVTGALITEITIVSPAGGTVAIDNAAGIAVTVTPGTVVASEAQVRVQSRPVSAEALSVDLTRVDADLRDRVQSGALVVAVDNPFAVAGDFELRVTAPAVVDVRGAARVAPGTTTVRVDLARDEIRALLGRVVSLSLSGTADGTADAVTVRPADAMRLSPRLTLMLEIGS
jgi:hypothetical protein